jgi:hypothetical protein
MSVVQTYKICEVRDYKRSKKPVVHVTFSRATCIIHDHEETAEEVADVGLAANSDFGTDPRDLSIVIRFSLE